MNEHGLPPGVERPTVENIRKEPELTFNGLQAIVEGHDRMAGFHEQELHDILPLLESEFRELDEEVYSSHPTREGIAGEIADVVILLTKLANIYGLDMNRLITGKVSRNYHKYAVPAQQGIPTHEAKANWDRSQDKHFLKGV